jgi:hypothetical protein
MSSNLLTYLDNVLQLDSVKNSLHASGAIHAAQKELIRQAKLIADQRAEIERLESYTRTGIVPWNRSRPST